VAERDGEIVGFSAVLPRPDRSVEVDGLFVEPTAWRQSIGAHLIRDAERRARLDGATSLHVIANPTAEKFYIACGFTFEAEEKTRFGVARTMRKTI
jgi:N-acetylglutamate synthase-like GNAT family acetyltransferase